MRIEPVFLVAPRSPAAAVSRRSFLFAGAMFAGGASLGGACAFAASHRAAAPAAAASTTALAPTGDVELDQLRRLAVDGADAELVRHRLLFVASTFSHYSRDAVLWHGVARLCGLVARDPDFPDRGRFARALVGVIERADAPFAAGLQEHVAALRGLR